MFLNRFFPREYYKSVYDVDYEALLTKGFRGLLFDIDNTLAAFDIPEPPESVIMLLNKLKKMGFAVCLFSNNNAARVEGFNKTLALPAVHKAGKPKKRGIEKALRLLSLPKQQVAIIGDQLFTDVWGGNRSGVHTILVDPLAARDEWTVKLKRKPEKILKNIYFKRQQKTGGN